jgi:hypothetical protein
MIKFSEWLKEKEYQEMLESLEEYSLNEIPRVFDDVVNPKYIDDELIQPLIKAVKDKKMTETDIKINDCNLVYYSINKIDYIFALGKPGVGLIGATKIFRLQVNDSDVYYKVTITKKLKDEIGNMLYKLYKEISKFLDVYVVTDNLQSIQSSTIWKKMFNEQKKYNIKDLKVIQNSKVVNINNSDEIWGKEKEFEKILVAIKFN